MIKYIKRLPKNYIIASIITLIILVMCVLNPSEFLYYVDYLNKILFKIFGDFYLWFIYLALILFVLIGISPLGKIKLGGKDAKPDYTMFSWFSMLFCAGMGVGIFFWGGAEPLMYYLNPFLQGTHTPTQNEINSFQMVFFHWCFHPWAIYGLTTLLIAFFSMNLQKGIHFGSFLFSDNNENHPVKKVVKSIVNNITTLAILFGVVASFGFGVAQFEGGLHTLLNIQPSLGVKIIIILFITLCYMISSLRGLSKGIKVLSNISMVLSFVLLGFIAFAVPARHFLLPLVKALPKYILHIHQMSIGALPFKDNNFLNTWTIKYWAWWTAWAPFVGIFVAMISRGRTIRQLVFGMLLIPSIYSIVAFTLMGEAAIYLQNTQHIVSSVFTHREAGNVLYKICLGLFNSSFLAWLGLIIVGIYFINSADSATYTLAAISQNPKRTVKILDGKITIRKPPAYLQICWGIT
ncbi:MAG: BCCT family transporter, partial [Bacteroidales bacterium]|nr:BCCT family transporter [Bacteroidales bacterium]